MQHQVNENIVALYTQTYIFAHNLLDKPVVFPFIHILIFSAMVFFMAEKDHLTRTQEMGVVVEAD